MDQEEQKRIFQKNWEKNVKKFGTKSWQADPDFLYFVEIPIEKTCTTKLEKELASLKSSVKSAEIIWTLPENWHVTLALPGRLGVHFQGNDVKFMKKELKRLCGSFKPFEITFGDLNCFPEVLFREAYDEKGTLYDFHNAICKSIPFAQDPKYQLDNFLPHLSLGYFLGGTTFLFSEFERKLGEITMPVNKIVFGKARNAKGKYEKKEIETFGLGTEK